MPLIGTSSRLRQCINVFEKNCISRRYHQSKFVQRTTQNYPLQAEVDKDAPAITGYNRILHRLANIILNITEKQPTKILHVFPSTGMLKYLGREVNQILC